MLADGEARGLTLSGRDLMAGREFRSAADAISQLCQNQMRTNNAPRAPGRRLD
jgi:hypothetical protein